MAKTTLKSASLALEIHILVPVIMYSSPSRTMQVRSAAASEPLPGSERAKAASEGRSVSGPRKRFFCASVPAINRGEIPSSDAVGMV